ncbi:MAG TPA: hypothetical protein VG432_16055 [Gemmatimonadaceae bacterium]|nr:hypothetical protein [Gemmatimonadaceae bacterium]
MTLGALAFAAALHTPHAVDTLQVVLVVNDTAAQRSLLRGVRLGAEEASHTGALFGTSVTLRVESGSVADPAIGGGRSPLPGASHASLYVVAGDASTCSRVMLRSAPAKIPVLDAGCALDDSVRAATVYSLTANPGRTTSAGDSARLELWHWSLERFGAEQLNERFRRRFGARMDSPAWTGWFAMKIALDAALHAKATDSAALLRELADPRAQYDGQKGRPLRFARDTRRLIQPRYRIAGHGDAEHVIAEVNP